MVLGHRTKFGLTILVLYIVFSYTREQQRKISLFLVTASVYPKNCVASGPGLRNSTVERQLNTTIQSMDFWGNKLTTGGTNYTFTSIPLMAAWAFYDLGDGTVTLSYMPEHAGNYVIDIFQGGVRISSSPFTGLTAAPGK
jgi:hypothetical protein